LIAALGVGLFVVAPLVFIIPLAYGVGQRDSTRNQEMRGETMVRTRRALSAWVALSLTLSLFLTALPIAGTVKAAIIEVNPGGSIQDAINAAAPGDTILVPPGQYIEDLTIDKSLTLRSSGGAANTTIEGTVAIDIEDDEHVVLGGTGSGFEITGSGNGIEATVQYWSSLSIAGNTVTDNAYGIFVSHVRYFSELDISGNTITENESEGIYIEGSGAVRYYSSASIIDNVITNNGDDGIYWNDIFENSHGLIQGNTITGNDDDGIWFDDVEHGSSLDILDNTVSNNAGRGIYINEYEENSRGLIRGNTITNNGSDGIYLSSDVEERSRLIVEANTINANGGYGFRVADAEDNGYLGVLDNEIRDNAQAGIRVGRIDEGGEGLIEGNTVTGNGGYGISIEWGVDEGSSLSILDNSVSGTQAVVITDEFVGSGYQSGSYAQRDYYLAHRSIVPGSETIYVDDVAVPSTDYLLLAEEGYIVFDTAPAHGAEITADYSYGGIGVYVGNVDEGSSLTIDDNRVTDNGHGGVYIRQVYDGSWAVIGGDGNTITGNGVFGIALGYGYYDWYGDEWYYYGVRRGSSLSILNNTISSTSGNGIDILLIETGSEAVIEGNTIYGNDHGVYVGRMREGSRLDVVDNAVTDNSSGGVYAGGTISDSEVSVVENIISGNTGIGLQIGEGETLTDSMATIRCNTIYNNTEWGIDMVAEHSLVDISGNHVLANGTSGSEGGIYIDGSELGLVGIHQNSIASNYDWGLLNDSGEVVDATHNWWGDASGPYQDTTNTGGSGDEVSDDVDYSDWLTAAPALCAEHTPTVPTPSTLTVDGGGGADHTTIQDAIDAADPGDTIMVNPGTYSESPAIDKSLTVLSTDGAAGTTIDGTVTIELRDLETVVFGAVNAGFTVNGSSPGIEADVTFWSHLTIQGNIVNGCDGDGIDVDRVRNWSSLSVLDNEMNDNELNGISIREFCCFSETDISRNAISGNDDGIYIEHAWNYCQLGITGNTIEGNTSVGVHLPGYEDEWGYRYYAIRNQSSVVIVDNKIAGNGGWGIDSNYIRDNSHGLVQGNTVTGNDYDGIRFEDVDHGSSLDILDNTVSNNAGRGIFIDEYEEGSQGLIQGNTITNNGSDGLYIRNDVDGGSHLIVQENTITGNGEHGVRIEDVEYGGHLVIEGNTISGNDGDGISVEDVEYGSTLDILDNIVSGNGGRGIAIDEFDQGGLGLIQGNTVSGNGSDGICIIDDIDEDDIDEGDIDEGSRVTVQGNTITGNDGYGFHVDEVEYGGYLAVVDNVIEDNSDAGIYIDDIDSGSEVLIEGNTITGNEHGVYIDEMDDGGVLTIEGNDISGNAATGLWLCGDADTLEDSMATVLSNTLLQNGGWGIYAYIDHSWVDISSCNKVVGNTEGGIYIDGEDLYFVGINSNNIYGNSNFGLLNESGEVIDATYNWWGDVTGPSHPTNPAGKGDAISNNVAYTPWLNSACETSGLKAAFTASARSGKQDFTVRFTDLSTSDCEITAWLWDFGDGNTSTQQNPSHTYRRSGVFAVSLTIWDECGFSHSVTMKHYITVTKPTRDDTPEPAKLGVSYLHIDPLQVLPGQEVMVSANVCNSGEERGARTVSFMVNGEAVESQSVSVSGGACQQVTFTVARAVPGAYQVAIDGMAGQFSVVAPRTVTSSVPSQQQTGLGTAGIIAIIAVMLVLIAALIVVFRRI
jgi:PKD repeat protein/pectin methylesterase-like acyl-CoA thioesterase